MHKLILSFCLIAGLVLLAVPVWADSNVSDVLLSRVLVGTTESASEEFIEIENNTDDPVDVTGWCVVYTNAGSTSKRTLGCLSGPDAQTAVMLPPGGRALFVSTKLITALGLQASHYDVSFSGGMADSGGHVYLMPNASGDVAQAADEVDWGLLGSPGDGALPVGNVITRAGVNTVLQDTNDNQSDFYFAAASTDPVAYATTTYLQPDLCLNVDGFQTKVPPGDILDDQGNCSPPPVDVCLNIDGVQPAPPPSAVVDVVGNCLLDICPNLDGVQSVLPDDMELDQTGDCVLLMTSAPPSSESPDDGSQSDAPQSTDPPGDSSPDGDADSMDTKLPASNDLIVSELLPNPSGSDAGHEFIELYNSSGRDISLHDYKLRIIGTSATVTLTLPTIVIGAGEYVALYNDSLNFTLVNTAGLVSLVRTSDGAVVSTTDAYQSAGDDMAWALIGGSWQYTNQPTPGAPNLASLVVATILATTASQLKPCADNQYRSPDTGRCRLVAGTTTPTPCSVDQERNPDTNRCRKVAVVAVPVPCKAGQERNLETNRCRNIKAMPAADYGVLAAKTVKTTTYIWLIVVAAVVGAAVYAIWEWHVELWQFGKRVFALVKFRR